MSPHHHMVFLPLFGPSKMGHCGGLRAFKIPLFQAVVESILLYGSEAWTITRSPEIQLDGSYTRLLRCALHHHFHRALAICFKCAPCQTIDNCLWSIPSSIWQAAQRICQVGQSICQVHTKHLTDKYKRLGSGQTVFYIWEALCVCYFWPRWNTKGYPDLSQAESIWQTCVRHLIFWDQSICQAYAKHLTDKYKAPDRQVQSIWQTSVRCFVLVSQILCICLTYALVRFTDRLLHKKWNICLSRAVVK